MNQENISGKWKEIKGEIRNQWSKLTDDELERAKGNVESIAGLVEQRYGDAKDVAKQKVQKLMAKFSDEFNKGAEAVKDTLRDDEQKH